MDLQTCHSRRRTPNFLSSLHHHLRKCSSELESEAHQLELWSLTRKARSPQWSRVWPFYQGLHHGIWLYTTNSLKFCPQLSHNIRHQYTHQSLIVSQLLPHSCLGYWESRLDQQNIFGQILLPTILQYPLLCEPIYLPQKQNRARILQSMWII